MVVVVVAAFVVGDSGGGGGGGAGCPLPVPSSDLSPARFLPAFEKAETAFCTAAGTGALVAGELPSSLGCGGRAWEGFPLEGDAARDEVGEDEALLEDEASEGRGAKWIEDEVDAARSGESATVSPLNN